MRGELAGGAAVAGDQPQVAGVDKDDSIFMNIRIAQEPSFGEERGEEETDCKSDEKKLGDRFHENLRCCWDGAWLRVVWGFLDDPSFCVISRNYVGQLQFKQILPPWKDFCAGSTSEH